MIYDLTDEVKAIGSLNFEGNITPIEWFSHIRLPNNKPDLVSIILLSDIVYWYRPTTLRDEHSGKVISYKKKFKSDLLQKSYNDLENLFGLSRDQIKDSLQRLEKLNLIKRIFRNINSQGSSLANVMFIQIYPSNIANITEKKLDMGINPHICEDISPHLKGLIPTPQRINPHTYTKTTTKITTNNSLSKSPILNDISVSKECEREREMINIWDKEIREGKRKSVHSETRLIALKKVIEEYFEGNLDNWKSYCLNIKESNFLMGGGPNNWKADLTWAIQQENLIRVLEGYYHYKEEKAIENNVKDIILEEVESISKDPTWNRVKEQLKITRGEATYKSWFSKLVFKGYDKETIILGAPSQFIKDWILNNFKNDIIKLFKETEMNIKDIEIFVENENLVLV
jgi:DNA-binding Lrp family transcriptional regulator